MEDIEINIAEILKDCPKGMKLYSPAFGELSLVKEIHYKDKVICTQDIHGNYWNFYADGSYSDVSDECMLFPSKDQRDWSKFKKPLATPFEIEKCREGDLYWYVDECGVTHNRIDMNTERDADCWVFGNYFNTEGQAEYAAEKKKELFLSLRKEDE